MEFCILMQQHIVEAYMMMKQRRVEFCVSIKTANRGILQYHEKHIGILNYHENAHWKFAL